MLNVEIIINKDFEGPPITELTDILADAEGEIKVDWSNSRDEISTILKFPTKKFILYVRDFKVRDRTVASLGLFLKLEEPVLNKAKDSLIKPQEYDWRNFVKANENGPSTKNILLKLAADALRSGKRPALAEIMEQVFCGGIGIVDVDVLMRLKGKRGN